MFTVTTTDNVTHDIAITITGANDLSEITVVESAGDSDTGAITEDVDNDASSAAVELITRGTLTVSDVDANDTARFTSTGIFKSVSSFDGAGSAVERTGAKIRGSAGRRHDRGHAPQLTPRQVGAHRP